MLNRRIITDSAQISLCPTYVLDSYTTPFPYQLLPLLFLEITAPRVSTISNGIETSSSVIPPRVGLFLGTFRATK